jgi:hypothetical protein
MTALSFRNVEASPDDPVSDWPLEAVQIALERGDLSHWQRLGEAIRSSPWGKVARGVEEVLTYSRPCGVAEAMEPVIARARVTQEEAEREREREREREAVAIEINQLSRRKKKTRFHAEKQRGRACARPRTAVSTS